MIISKHTKILCFKFYQNRPINEEFDFFEGEGRGRGGGGRRGRNKKKHVLHWLLVHFGIFQSAIKTSILDILTRGFLQYVSLCLLSWSEHSKFQHSSSIRKCLKIGRNIRLLVGLKGPWGGGDCIMSKINRPLCWLLRGGGLIVS